MFLIELMQPLDRLFEYITQRTQLLFDGKSLVPRDGALSVLSNKLHTLSVERTLDK